MKSIPKCFFIVKYFTKSAFQYKYRLFSIYFTISLSLLLLICSQIGFAQFPYADAKKLTKIDKDELIKIIELNKSSLFKDLAYENGIFILIDDELSKLEVINDPASANSEIDLSILKKVGKQLTSIGNSDLLKKLQKNAETQKGTIPDVPDILGVNSILLNYSEVYKKFQILDTTFKSIELATVQKTPEYLTKFNSYITKLQDDRTRSLTILEGIKNLIGRVVYVSTIDVKNLNDLAEIRELKEEVFGIYNPNSQDLTEINAEIKSSQSLSGFSEAALIDASATFIAEQIKANIVNDVFSTLIDKDLEKKFVIIFPKTLRLLKDFQSTNMLIGDMTVSLRKVISEDLKNILHNLRNTSMKKLKEDILSNTSEVTTIEKELKTKFDFIVDIMQHVVSGAHPIDLFPIIVNNIKNDSILNSLTNMKDYFVFFDVMQESLRDANETSSGNIWLTIKKIDDLKVEKEQFLKNISLKIKKAGLSDFGKTFDSLYVEKFDTYKYQRFQKDIYKFLSTLAKFENLIKKITKSKTSSVTDYENYMENIYDVLFNFHSFYEIYSKRKFDINIEPTLKTVRRGIDVYKSISSGNYSTILSSSLLLVDELKLFNPENDFKKDFIKFVSLFTEIVNAKSTEQMKDAISKASSNSGGFMVKRNSGLHISLNAYGGFTFAREELLESHETENVFGVTAPIGLEFTINNPRLGIFISAIDIGAVVSWRFNSKENIPNTITLKQVVSPGVFLRGSPFKNSAFTIMGGVQWNPELREVINSQNVSTRQSTFRFGLSLTYDIPILFIL